MSLVTYTDYFGDSIQVDSTILATAEVVSEQLVSFTINDGTQVALNTDSVLGIIDQLAHFVVATKGEN